MSRAATMPTLGVGEQGYGVLLTTSIVHRARRDSGAQQTMVENRHSQWQKLKRTKLGGSRNHRGDDDTIISIPCKVTESLGPTSTRRKCEI
jgi:hypothetical protein